ncbi:hypothetical protein ES705_40105 [subsurface metagenome]
MPKLKKSLKLDEFLNPRSMLTPGAAGGLTMVISTNLWVRLNWSQEPTALAISFAFGLLSVVREKNISLLERIIYCALNTLFIFAISFGAHSTIYG